MPKSTTGFYSSNVSLDRAKDLVKGSLKALNIGHPHNDSEYKTPILDDTASVQNNSGWTPLLALAGVATVLGSCVPVGYNIGVMNTPADIIRRFCNDSIHSVYGIDMSLQALDFVWSVIVSIFLVGGVTGSLAGGIIADNFGRKGAVVINNILGLIAAILFLSSRYASSVEMLFFGRLVVGLSAGLVTSTVPMYLTEISPISIRGSMGVLCPLGITVGVLLGQILGLQSVFGRECTWHFLLVLYALLIMFGATFIPFLPESPKYLCIVKKEDQKAVRELCRLRGNCSVDEATTELLALKNSEMKEQGDGAKWNTKRILTNPEVRLPLLLVCALQAGQQCSGINAVFYYSMSIFTRAGLNTEESQYATIGAGCMNLLVTIIAIPLVNRCGRRKLALISCWLAACCLVLLTISITYIDTVTWMPYVAIIAVISYVFCYGLGLGPIPYFIGSELFRVGPRPAAMSLGSMANWAGNFIVGMTFPSLQSYIGQYSFLLFALTTVLLVLFLRSYLPETKGRNPSEIADMLRYGFKSDIINPKFSPQENCRFITPDDSISIEKLNSENCTTVNLQAEVETKVQGLLPHTRLMPSIPENLFQMGSRPEHVSQQEGSKIVSI